MAQAVSIARFNRRLILFGVSLILSIRPGEKSGLLLDGALLNHSIQNATCELNEFVLLQALTLPLVPLKEDLFYIFLQRCHLGT